MVLIIWITGYLFLYKMELFCNVLISGWAKTEGREFDRWNEEFGGHK